MRDASDMLCVPKRTVDPNMQIDPDVTKLRFNPAPAGAAHRDDSSHPKHPVSGEKV
jgi:hypothetical protein